MYERAFLDNKCAIPSILYLYVYKESTGLSVRRRKYFCSIVGIN